MREPCFGLEPGACEQAQMGRSVFLGCRTGVVGEQSWGQRVESWPCSLGLSCTILCTYPAVGTPGGQGHWKQKLAANVTGFLSRKHRGQINPSGRKQTGCCGGWAWG